MFGALGTVFLLHLLSAKWAELVQLMQKFIPRSRVGSFRNERLRNTPWDPKPMLCCIFVMVGCIWDRFVTALNSMEMGQSIAINAKVRVTKSRLNLSLRTHPIHTIRP